MIHLDQIRCSDISLEQVAALHVAVFKLSNVNRIHFTLSTSAHIRGGIKNRNICMIASTFPIKRVSTT